MAALPSFAANTANAKASPPGAAPEPAKPGAPTVTAPAPEPAEVKAPEPGADEYWTAVKLFESKKPGDVAAGRTALEKAASREYTHAQLLLGECYAGGQYGFPINKRKAAGFIRLAAERGNGFAKMSYGMCLFSGFGVWKDQAKAAEWLTAAVADDADYSLPVPRPDSHGSGASAAEAAAASAPAITGAVYVDPVASAKARAHFVLGIIAEQRKKLDQAQAHYVAAATAGGNTRAGIQLAAYQAAINYAFGHGVARDHAKATEMLNLGRTLVAHSAVSLVHNYAVSKLIDDFAVSELEEAVTKATDELTTELEFKIGEEFTDRKSKDYNPREAIQWFELAAESGKAWAMLELGLLYTRGDLGAPEPEKAFKWFEKAGRGDDPKHYLGVADLVISYENGLGVAKDPQKAREIARKHADTELVCYLTLRNQCPKSILTFEQLVDLNKRLAKEKDAFAQYLLGRRYENGWGVEADFDTAESWLKKAAKQNLGLAYRDLGQFYDAAARYRADAWEMMNKYYRAGAQLKDSECLGMLGYNTLEGRGVPKDAAAAEALLKQALELDPKLAMALNNLGAIYEERFRDALKGGDGAKIKTLKEQMLHSYEAAAALGFARAAKNLGDLYSDGSLGEPDFTKAYSYFQQAADGGEVYARFRLGEMHDKGQGVPVTPEEAAYHYRLAALDGNALARRRLIVFYLDGKSGAQDLDRAAFWLELDVRNGAVDDIMPYVDVLMAQQKFEAAVRLLNELKGLDSKVISGFAYERLSRCYAAGTGVKINADRAKSYCEKAVKLGNADAMFSMANELLLQKKEAEAMQMYMRSADSGSAFASYALGQMYFFGQHVPANPEKALVYLRKAAEANHADALYFLAGMSYNRVPGAPSLDEAIQFAKRAEALGNKKAEPLRDRLERRRVKNGAPPSNASAHAT